MVGRTESEAQAIFAELNRNIDTAQAFTVLSERLGADMSAYPLDEPVPDLPETEHLKGRSALLLAAGPARQADLARALLAGGGRARPPLLVGSADADRRLLESWFRSGAADGFIVMPPFFPSSSTTSSSRSCPILQERGLFRTDYRARRCATISG